MTSEHIGGAESSSVAAPASISKVDWRRLVAPVSVVAAVLVILLAGGLTTQEFLTVDNFLIVVRSASITGIVALGMTFVTLSGNFFSLSVEQTAALCSIVFSEGLLHGFGLAASLVLALATSIAVGLGQGFVIAAGLNPIVVTLGAGAGLRAAPSGSAPLARSRPLRR